VSVAEQGVSAVCVLGALLLVLGCVEPGERGQCHLLEPVREDRELIRAIREAIERNVSPERIETVIGTRAILNTLRENHRRELTNSDIGEDKDERGTMEDISIMKGAEHVVMWARIGKPGRVVAACWLEDRRVVLVFGRFLTPERLSVIRVARETSILTSGHAAARPSLSAARRTVARALRCRGVRNAIRSRTSRGSMLRPVRGCDDSRSRQRCQPQANRSRITGINQEADNERSFNRKGMKR